MTAAHSPAQDSHQVKGFCHDWGEAGAMGCGQVKEEDSLEETEEVWARVAENVSGVVKVDVVTGNAEAVSGGRRGPGRRGR